MNRKANLRGLVFFFWVRCPVSSVRYPVSAEASLACRRRFYHVLCRMPPGCSEGTHGARSGLIAHTLSAMIQTKTQLEAGQLLRSVRHRAGLSQRELARRAGSAQSLISRIERGLTAPTTSGLRRLLDAAGFELRMEATVKPVFDSHMLLDIDRIRSMSPEDRLIEVANISRFETEVRRAVSGST